MLYIIELQQEFNALMSGKITICQRCGHAETLGEIADNGNDIRHLSIHAFQSYGHCFEIREHPYEYIEQEFLKSLAAISRS